MKFNRYIAFALLFVLCLSLFVLTACKKEEAGSASSFSLHPDADGWPDGTQEGPDSTDDSSAVGSSGSISSSNATGGAPSSTGSGDAPPANDAQDDDGVHTFTGVIDDAGMGKFYVEADDGQTIGFPFDGVDLSGLEDSMPGSPIVVYYTGTLQGTDTSTIQVIKMETPK